MAEQLTVIMPNGRLFGPVDQATVRQWLHAGHNTILIQVDRYAHSRLMLKTVGVAGV